MSPAQLRHVTRFLDPFRPNVLTIGFARRFATYKRATLLLRDRARLARLVNDAERPVIFLFAGKAHPADEPGKQVLRELRQLMMSQEFVGRIIFLEDYDLQLARSLVSGVDVWLNNPIAPLEASGTSGIKAAINGRLNLSILDGWWAEGSMQDNGWGIPPANVLDPERRDALEAELILDALEEEVIPSLLRRGRDRQLTGMGGARPARPDDRHTPGQYEPGAPRDYTRGLYRPAGGAVPAARSTVASPARRSLAGVAAADPAEGLEPRQHAGSRRRARGAAARRAPAAAGGCQPEWLAPVRRACRARGAAPPPRGRAGTSPAMLVCPAGARWPLARAARGDG